ncbi:hypothetical protein Syun_002821 [Stephania yunnanensis]|uniref:Glabrous enhancer-binding protein-like DBD domain-containing protein n=1 Tax=Stephania yunnanensis TaxID=152371 RepID=A0AAP0Q113_9MAGN
MPRTPANHLPSNDDEEEEEESIKEEEEVPEEEEEEEEEEEVDEEVVEEEDDDDGEEEEEPQQQSNRVKDEDEEEDDEASPTDGLTAITPTRSSKRVASPVDVDHINPKRLKNHHDDHSKSSSQQRTTWTLEDELVLLNGIIDFKKSHNLDPFSDMDAFFHSIMHSLRLQVSTQQLKRKIRALKDKFNTYAIRPTKNAKPNNSQVYNLSMKIWGQNQDEEEEEEDDDEDDEDDIIATKRTPQQQREKTTTTTPQLFWFLHK